MFRLLVSLLPAVTAKPRFRPPAQPSRSPGCRLFSNAACSAGLRSMVTDDFGASTGPAVLVATTISSPLVVTVPTTVLLPRLTFRSPAEVMLWMASNFTVTSPSYSVLITRDLPSDLEIEPVRRSPFFRTTWSANAGIVTNRTNNKGRPATSFLCTKTSWVIQEWVIPQSRGILRQVCGNNGISRSGRESQNFPTATVYLSGMLGLYRSDRGSARGRLAA